MPLFFETGRTNCTIMRQTPVTSAEKGNEPSQGSLRGVSCRKGPLRASILDAVCWVRMRGTDFARRCLRIKNGQTLIEYTLLLFLIVTIVVIAALTQLSSKPTNTFDNVQNTLP